MNNIDILELMQLLDKRLQETSPAVINEDTYEHWHCYEDCKKIIREYEKKNNRRLDLSGYRDCVNYITNRLNI